MRALVLRGPELAAVEERATPRPGPDEVLLRVEACGLCGTDLESWTTGGGATVSHEQVARDGAVLGHEVVARVAEPARDLVEGTLVLPDVVVTCRRCFWCLRDEPGLCEVIRLRGFELDGGLATYMVADAASCLRVPAGLEPTTAVLVEPLAVAVRALAKAPDVRGALVAVCGGGSIGLLVARVALLNGAAAVVVSEPHPDKRALGERMGALAVCPEDLAATVAGFSEGRGADVVLECSGVPAVVREAVLLARRGGRVVLIGIADADAAIPLVPTVLGERIIVGSAAHAWHSDGAAALGLLARGLVDATGLITDVVDLDHAVTDGFQRLRDDRGAVKIIVQL